MQKPLLNGIIACRNPAKKKKKGKKKKFSPTPPI